MKEWTIQYTHIPEPEVEHDTFHCEAETEEEAMGLFEAATAELDEVEVKTTRSKEYVDPNQLKFDDLQEAAL